MSGRTKIGEVNIPVNATMVPLTPETLPPDWMRLRDQWEYAHAARAILQVIALAALVLSILVETPANVANGSGRLTPA